MSEAKPLGHEIPVTPDEKRFLAFVEEHFDARYYLDSYSDVADSGLDPLRHWLSCGVSEQRQISASIVLRYGKIARRSSSRIWRHYNWRGHDLAVRFIKPIPAEVIAQIFNQARHDPAVLAAGAAVVATLSQQDRENVHLDVAGLRRALPRTIEFLLLVPSVETSEDLGLTTGFTAALRDAGLQSIHMIVTEDEAPARLDRLAVPEAFRDINVMFWSEFWIHGPQSVNLGQLAQLISVLQPRVAIVADSRRGNEMLAHFGRGLSQKTQLYWLCSGEFDGDDRETGLLPMVLPFATVLTDDCASADRLRRRYAQAPMRGIVALPRRPPTALRDAVAALFRRP